MTREEYLSVISNRSDRFGSQLLKLLDYYNADCLIEITYDQAKDFYEELVANGIDDSSRCYNNPYKPYKITYY